MGGEKNIINLLWVLESTDVTSHEKVCNMTPGAAKYHAEYLSLSIYVQKKHVLPSVEWRK